MAKARNSTTKKKRYLDVSCKDKTNHQKGPR